MDAEQVKIWFVGAGPGDPSLLTIKAAAVLRNADAVVTDRLVSEEILSTYVNPSAEIFTVGKQGGSLASVPQQEINELLVQLTKRYKKIVRLKGGDISIFSNILDELLTVTAAGIAYEMVPGITALSGAAAYTGVPLTARGLSTGVRILTYYNESVIATEAWKEMALFNDTLVFYMSASNLPQVAAKLLEAGADTAIPLLVVEQATTPNQHVHYFTLENFLYTLPQHSFISPSLVIIGKVAGLYEQFAWLPNYKAGAHYFTPLEDKDYTLFELINGFQNHSHVSSA